MAAIDPVAFVRSTPPFDALPAPAFDEAARELEIGYFPAGSWLVRVGQQPLEHLYVIRKGIVRLERNGQTLQVLEEGEIFGYTSLLTGKATLDALVEEDLLAYRLPAPQFRRLLSDARFSGHFAVGLAERLKSSLEQKPAVSFQPDLSVEVEKLLRRPAVWVGAEATVGEAALVMREQRVSSVLVRGEPPGIVTDRDFRNRVLGAGLGPGTPVAQVLSRPLRTVESGAPIYEAWNRLLDAGVHHLPVRKGEEIAGVLTSSDLLKCSAQGPMAVLRQVERLSTRESLPEYAARVAEMAAALLAGGLDAMVIAGFVGRLNDTLLGRILRWAEADLGEPPAPYAWIAFGSEGRTEQTLLGNQDNGLVYADEGAGHRDWYLAFAERVNADLAAAGFPESRGGHVARKLNDTLSEWARRFGECIDKPRLYDAALYFDFRRVGGSLDLERLEEAMGRSRRETPFLRFLAREATEFRPPQMLLMRLRGESSTVDLKRHGIMPVVFLARCYGLEIGTRARNTLERLEAAVKAGLMGPEIHAAVSQAFQFLVGLRLRQELRLVKAGRPATSEVTLSDLSAIERTRLKDAFRVISSWQEKAAFHFQTNFL
jgi:CBS domain-containing protein